MKTSKIFSFIFSLIVSAALGQNTNTVLQTNTYYQGATDNTLIGIGTGSSLISGGYNNSFLGLNAGNKVTYGKYNTFLGYYSGNAVTNALNNTFVGANSGLLTTGSNNCFFGTSSGENNASSGGNSYFGAKSGLNATGSANTFIGYGSGNSNGGSSSGSSNTYLGYRTGHYAIATGSKNVFIGAEAALYTEGSENVIIGSNAGQTSAASTGSGNVFIGNQAGSGNIGTASNQLVINSSSAGNVPDPLVRGNFSDKSFTLNVNNASSSNSRFQINSNANGYSGLRFGNLKLSSSSIGTNGRVLTVNSNGDVVLATDQIGTGAAVVINGSSTASVNGNGSTTQPYIIGAYNIYNHDDELTGNRTVDMKDYRMIFDTQSNGSIYIGDTTPSTAFNTGLGENFVTVTGPENNYRLFVEGGILTEKVKVALRSSTNWADYVFADDYKLKPLAEVEAFVKENKHLPGIESARELQCSGLDLADMQRKQMEKIEELTLYLIEQQKTIERQGDEIEILLLQMKSMMNLK